MTDDDVKDLLGRLVADPPASAVDTEGAIRAGRRAHARSRRVRLGTAAGGALAAAAVTFSVLAGGTEPADRAGTAAAELPGQVEVTCTPAGIEVSAKEIRTRPDGVAIVVSSTRPQGAFLKIIDPYADMVDATSFGWRAVPSTPTRWTYQHPPGDLVLRCGTAQQRPELLGEVMITVSDPDHLWHDRTELARLGCRGGETADWIAGLYRSGSTPVAAAQAVAEAFRTLKGNRDAEFTVEEVPLHYADGVNETWVAYRNGEPYVTVLVNRDGERYSAGPNDHCRGFDLSAG